MIKAIKLTKKFNSLAAVSNLNLEIKKGEIFGFIGPNGAGKTTTIKMMVGILPPTKGDVEINGISITSNPLDVKRIVGYIPDIPYVYPFMTGLEFLHFVAEIYQVSDKDKKISKLLKIYPIEGMINAYFKDFSRGTKQKVAIIATLLHEPKVLIIDEPISGLDPQSSQITKDLLVDFSKGGGTVFVCTHTLPVIEEVCSRIGVIDKGKLVFTGTLTQLKNKLKSKEAHLEQLYLQITKAK